MKRYTDTEKWSDPWFRKLSPVAKALWSWFCDNCDDHGMIEPDWELIEFQVGEPCSIEMLGDRVIPQEDGRYYEVRGFTKFQEGIITSQDQTATESAPDAFQTPGLPGSREPFKAPVSLQAAIDRGIEIGVDPDVTREWWFDRDGCAWTRMKTPITRWTTDLMLYVRTRGKQEAFSPAPRENRPKTGLPKQDIQVRLL